MPKKAKDLKRFAYLFGVLLMLAHATSAQRTLSGRVISKSNQQPLANATVTVRGTQIATETDSSGFFRVTVPKDNSVVEISSVGYETLALSVSGRKDFGDISLVLSSSTLNEVYVTGYSTQKKRDITGSVAVVNVTDMKQTPSGSTESLLQGQAAGVTVFSTGAPGGASVVQIRGITSAFNSTPLIIIDGVPGSMHDLNVNDIQSIQVLKDAGAAAIYGVRGSNGVIIITTKRGTGAFKISYDAYVGMQIRLGKSWDMATPTQTGEAKWAQATNDGLVPSDPQYGNGPAPVLPYYITPTGAPQGAPNTSPSDYNLYNNHITLADQAGNNWFNDIFYKSAPIMDHNISVSGGTGKSTSVPHRLQRCAAAS